MVAINHQAPLSTLSVKASWPRFRGGNVSELSRVISGLARKHRPPSRIAESSSRKAMFQSRPGSVLVSPEMYKHLHILGDDFRTRFCIQPLAWFNSGYSSCVNATVTRQCRSSTAVGVKRSRHAELLGFRQSSVWCPPPRGEEYEHLDSWPWVLSCPGLISWVATPTTAIQAVHLGLGEKIDVCILFRRDGQIQANEQDIVLSTRLVISGQGDLCMRRAASLLIDIQVSYSALD